MTLDAIGIIVTIMLCALANGGLFLYKFGGLTTRVEMNEMALHDVAKDISILKDDVGVLKGEAKAWQVS